MSKLEIYCPKIERKVSAKTVIVSGEEIFIEVNCYDYREKCIHNHNELANCDLTDTLKTMLSKQKPDPLDYL